MSNRRIEMRKTIYTGALALALVAGVAALSGLPLSAAAETSGKIAQPSAGQRVATLDVLNVSCATCAPVVKRALSSLSGVSDVSVKVGGASATVRVVYDPRKITPAALAAATTNAGYPAEIVNH
jgi:mercuric ion binding protein